MPTADEWRAALPGLRKAGGQHQGPCPVCGGTDRFRVNADGRFFCRRCCPDGRDPQAMRAILDAAGLDIDRVNGAQEHVGIKGLSAWW